MSIIHTIYRCGNRSCRQRGKEFKSMPIAGAVLATWKRVSCGDCGQTAWFVRNVYADKSAKGEDIAQS